MVRAGTAFVAASAIASSCGPVDEIWPLASHQQEAGHGSGAAPRRTGPDDSIFERDRLLDVEIELDPADWDQLRYEGKSIAEFFSLSLDDLAAFDYTTFPAQVRIDGRAYPDVGLSKAGYIGNLSSLTPQLAIDFGFRGRLRSGVRRMMLKNAIEDRSLVRECLGLELFASAGYPAPRCNYARVSVNGRELGYYVNAEVVDERMLARHFADGSGDIYHGEGADLFDNTLPLIRNENTPARGDRRDLEALASALGANDEELVSQLGALLDLDAFRDFWALETLLGHWDGYTNSRNNYYLYNDPKTGRFHFLPWDLDQAFVGAVSFKRYEITVYFAGRVANRLYQNPEQRELFRRRLGELNAVLWQPDALLRRAAELAALVPSDPGAFESLRAYLLTHGEALSQALAQPAPEVPITEPYAPPVGDECTSLVTPLSGSFETVVSEDVYGSDAVRGSGQLQATPDGEPLAGDAFSFAGPDAVAPGEMAVYVASELADGTWLGFPLVLPRDYFQPGVYPLHAYETFIPATAMLPFDTSSIAGWGYVIDGEIRLDRAGLEPGATVSGSFSGSLLQLGCSPRLGGPPAAPNSPAP